MTISAENAQWYKGKRPLVTEYLKNAKQAEDITAGRGHLYRPGFMGRMITDVETSLKYKLSDLNYSIVESAVQREMVQIGFDYDLTFKNARIAWELEKAGLIAAMEQEFAGNKLIRELTDQELDQLEITINLRQLVIMAAKTAIDLEMEGYRQELTTVDQSTFPAEDALLNAKLLTAQKKLEVIPYIESVLEKQALIITTEEDNATRKESLITKKELLSDERLKVITAKQSLVLKLDELVIAKRALIEAKAGIITAKDQLASAKLVNLPYMQQYIDILSDLNTARQEIATTKLANLPYMDDYFAAIENLNTAKGYVADEKFKNLPYMDDYITALEELSDAKQAIADAKTANLPYMDAQMVELELLLEAKESLVTTKLLNIPYMQQYIAASEELIDAHGEVIVAKQNLIPKLNEKAAVSLANSAQTTAWVAVKQAIGLVKEESAGHMETRADYKGQVADAKTALNDAEALLIEAKLNLEMAKMTGTSDLLVQQTSNLPLMLTEKQTFFDKKLTRDAELTDKMIDVSTYKSQKAYEAEDEANDIEFDAEKTYMSRESVMWNWKEDAIADISANATVTSQLVHLLA